MIIYSHVIPPTTPTTVYNIRKDIEDLIKLPALCLMASGRSYGWLVGDGEWINTHHKIYIYLN